jgi:hypothetical protein
MKKLLCVAVAMIMGSATVFADDAAVAAKPGEPATAPELKEEEDKCPVSLDLAFDFYSAYVWRGNIINDRPVWQPYAKLSYSLKDYGSLWVSGWGNFDATDRNKHHTFAGLNEIDYTAGYTVTVQDFELEAGNIWYTYPKANGKDYGKTCAEAYGKVTYKNETVEKLFEPSVAVYRDYLDADGYYVALNLNREFEINDQLAVGGDLALGLADDDYLEYYYGDGADGTFSDFTADVYATYKLNETFSITGKLAWTSLLGSDARDNVDADGTDTDELWGGIDVSASF